MKTCSVCKIAKEMIGFSVDQKSKDGLQHRCKDCDRTYHQVHWASRIVRASQSHDIRAGRPVHSVDYIDEMWVTELVRESPNCHYCDVPVRYGPNVNRQTNPDGLQLDRKDSALPHTKSNCVQCCQTCNNRCKTLPYKWKILTGGGDFAHFEMRWCPGHYHNGGDGGDHVRGIGDFVVDSRNPGGIATYCRVCQARYYANRLIDIVRSSIDNKVARRPDKRKREQ